MTCPPVRLLQHPATLLLIAVLIALVGPSSASTASTRSSSSTPSRRVVQPHFRPLHVLSAVYATSPSHVTLPLELCKVLAARGHRISWVELEDNKRWVGTAEERAQLPFSFLSAEGAPSMNASFLSEVIQLASKDGMKGLDLGSKVYFEGYYSATFETTRALIEHDRPDVMICDLFAHSCTDIADKMGIPFVMTFPGGMGDFGLGDQYDTPNQFTGYSQQWHNQPLWHRFYNTYLAIPYIIYHLGGVEARFNQMRAKFDIAPNVAPLDKWAEHDVIFNGNYAWDWSKPLPPYFHMLGPIARTTKSNLKDVNKLTTAQREWLDESERLGIPVILLAFGTMAFSNEREQAVFQQAFASCPALPLSNTTVHASTHSSADSSRFRVVWQSNTPLAESVKAALPNTVREEAWVAQPAVLSHPATALFITHAGSSSLMEGIGAGLPLLAVPFFGDQPGNAIRLQDAGVALRVDHKTMTADELCHSIRHLVYDSEVRANVDRVQQIYHLSRHGAERGADVVERAAYVGTQHLIPYRERSDVSWVVRYNVDVYAIGVGIVALLVYAVYRAVAPLVGAGLGMAGVRRKSKVA